MMGARSSSKGSASMGHEPVLLNIGRVYSRSAKSDVQNDRACSRSQSVQSWENAMFSFAVASASLARQPRGPRQRSFILVGQRVRAPLGGVRVGWTAVITPPALRATLRGAGF